MKHDFIFDFKKEKLYSGIGDSLADIVRLCPDPSVIFDIGCYDGGDAVRLKEAFPKASVYAIEASPERFKTVIKVCEPLGIVCLQKALGNTRGQTTLDMRYINGVPHCGTLKGFKKHPPGEVTTQIFEVEMTTLSALAKQYGIKKIDILHMDVEGSESDVLEGMGSLRPIVMSLETNGSEWFSRAMSKKDVLSLACSFGYSVCLEKPNDAILEYTGRAR